MPDEMSESSAQPPSETLRAAAARDGNVEMRILEEWRTVPNWEGFYEISSIGRVRSLTRTLSDGRRQNGRLLKANISHVGPNVLYRQVQLSRGGRITRSSIHRLVASAFCGEPQPGQLVRHIDGDSLNNCVDNLAWGTASENECDKVRHGTNPMSSKTHCKNGHEFTEENTIRIGAGGRHRRCRTCQLAAQRRYNRGLSARAQGVRL